MQGDTITKTHSSSYKVHNIVVRF